MASPRLRPSLLRSRFGRRLFDLFLLCSLLPTAVLALLSFSTVTRQLRQASLDRLEQASRLLRNGIQERLQLLSDDLDAITLPVAPCGVAAGHGVGPACDGSLAYGLQALAFLPDNGEPVGLFGRMVEIPELSNAELEHLAGDRDLVLDRIVRGRPAIYLVHPARRGRGGGVLVGEVDPGYLWGSPEQIMLVPTMQFHIVNRAGRVISSSNPGEELLPAPVRSLLDRVPAGAFEWDIGGLPYLASYGPIGSDDRRTAADWTLAVSEAWAAIVSPMADFNRTFLIVLALAMSAAFVLSLSQLRRSLAPLDALHEGTRRLSRREFDQPVVVNSRDEFAEVAGSFNAMADQIKRQFAALATAAEIDRAVLSSVETDRIVQIVLERMRDVCPCDVVALSLIDPEGGNAMTTWLEADPAGGQQPIWAAQLEQVERTRLACGPDAIPLQAGDAPGYLAALVGRGARSLVILPLRYQSQVLGAITLGGGESIGGENESLIQAQRVAGQVALALSNARMVDQIRFLAFSDSLTGLPNRVSFKQRLQEELERCGRQGGTVAVFFLDLDHFSRINDTLGHKLGDRLVQEVGKRVKGCCHEAAPAAEVARLGGDEFTVILPDPPSPTAAADLARVILGTFDTPFALDGHEVFVSTSIGVAAHPADGTDLESLLKNADVAMYEAKRKGRNRIELYTDSMSASAARRLSLEHQLRKAFEAGHFALRYQPIADLASGRIAGAEALIRWEHPEWGTVPPAEFITVCEESGLILPVGEWILRTVCEQNRTWQREGLLSIPIAINISGQQLRSDAAVETVRGILAATGLDPRYLVLELTESNLMHWEGDAATTLQALAGLGVGLAIDDFGTGYSSLSYLKHFPVHTLKIDKSFVRDVSTDPDDAAITSAVIAMGGALGLRVIAEGVETEAQVAFLRRQGCDAVQGFWVGRPVTSEAFSAHLRGDGVIAALRRDGSGSSNPPRRRIAG